VNRKRLPTRQEENEKEPKRFPKFSHKRGGSQPFHDLCVLGIKAGKLKGGKV